MAQQTVGAGRVAAVVVRGIQGHRGMQGGGHGRHPSRPERVPPHGSEGGANVHTSAPNGTVHFTVCKGLSGMQWGGRSVGVCGGRRRQRQQHDHCTPEQLDQTARDRYGTATVARP